MKALHVTPSPLLQTLGVTNNHILGETFYSMAALRYGRYVANISAVPISPSIRALTGAPIAEDDSALRDAVATFFQKETAEYELRAQLLSDVGRMPIEDASIMWPEDRLFRSYSGRTPQTSRMGSTRLVQE